MTPDEADALGKRIINNWRGGPPLVEWIDALVPLHAGQAGTTFIRLRDELEHAPSIAKFRQTYRGIHTRETDERCEACGGNGTVTGPTFDRNGHTYTSAIPCPSCEAGRAAARWMTPYAAERADRERRAAAIAANAAEHGQQLATVTNLFDEAPL